MDSATLVAISIVVYVIALFALSFLIKERDRSSDDFIVAGRRLGFPLATATLLATWVGAGTMLATADEVRNEGLCSIALEPVGPGVCLILTAFLFAKPLWNARLLTLNDLYRRRFGPGVEKLSALYTLSFVHWIAVQLLGVAGILGVYFEDITQTEGVLIVATVAVAYTMIGGMWSVTLTDAFQLVILVIGVGVLGWEVLAALGNGELTAGVERMRTETPDELLVALPHETTREIFQSLGLILSGTIALIPSQDLMQRVFASRSARTAFWACLAAGILYLVLGIFPIVFGLGARLLLPDTQDAVVAALSHALLSPGMKIIVTLGLLSVVMSSLDSALLAPSSVIAQNVIGPALDGKVSTVTITRGGILAFGAISASLAIFLDESKFGFLESSYSMTIAPFVVLLFAVHQKDTRALPAFLVLAWGLSVWILEQVGIWPADAVPFTLVGAFAIYLLTDQVVKRNERR